MQLVDRRFLDFHFIAEGFLTIDYNSSLSPVVGKTYILQDAKTFGSGDFDYTDYIAKYKGNNANTISSWEFSEPKTGDEYFLANSKEIVRYDGSEWETIATIPSNGLASSELTLETHTLTAEEITNKSFTLSHSIKTGKENDVLLLRSGFAFIPNTDFTASGNRISWTNKELANFDLRAGDIFMIQYIY